MSLDRRGIEPGTALVPFMRVHATAPRARFRKRHAVWASGLLVALGAGGFGLAAVRSGEGTAANIPTLAKVDTTADVLRQLHAEVAQLRDGIESLHATGAATRQEEAMRGLKKSVDDLRQDVEQVRTASTANLAQLSSRIEAIDHGPASKVADLQGRIDRLERQVSSAVPTGSIAAGTRPAAAASVPPALIAPPVAVKPPILPAKPQAKQDVSLVPQSAELKPAVPARSPVVVGWVLRDVYDGVALVEGRAGLREIAPGEFLPGAGEVRSIERHGRSWVVVTSRGTIENSMW